MRGLLAAIPLLLLAVGCGPRTTGSGVSKTESRSVATFSEVSAANGVEVAVHVGAAPSISVSGDDNLVPLVETVVSGERLRIGYKSGQNIDTKLPMHVDVTVPALKGVSASSGVHLTADGVKGDAFELHASSGVTATVSGTASSLALDASSGVHVDAGGLAAKTATIHASSGAIVKVRASEGVSGEASSGSSVTVLGAPKTRGVSTSSGASVTYE